MKKLSIITTVYNKGNISVTQIKRLVNFVNSKKIKSEIIVVIDGNTNGERKLIYSFIKENRLEKQIKIYSYLVNKGKGYAQRYGFNKSTGDVILFIDSDTDIRMRSLEVAFSCFIKNESKVDAIYPSKYHIKSDLDGTSKFRRFLSFGLKTLTFILLGKSKNIDDISCGLKIFKRSAFNQFNDELFVNRFATDSEIYFWVKRLNLNVISVPFFMNMPKNSTSVNFLEIVKVILDLILIGIRLRFSNLLKGSRVDLQNTEPIV